SYSHHRPPHSFPTRRSSDLSVTKSLKKPPPKRSSATSTPEDPSPSRFKPNRYPLRCHDPRRSSRGVSASRLRFRVAQVKLDQLRSEEHTSELQSRVDLVCRL